MIGRRPSGRKWDLFLMMVLLIVLSSLLVYAFHRRLMHVRRLGYLGLAIMSFLGGATVVLLPVPSLATTFAMGAVLNPWTVGLVASTAETLGTLSGFLLGAGVQEASRSDPERGPSQQHTFLIRLRSWMEHHGLWAVFVFSAIPSPALDIVGVAAGALRLNIWKFLVVCWLGKTIKTLAVAWGGAGALPVLTGLVLQ